MCGARLLLESAEKIPVRAGQRLQAWFTAQVSAVPAQSGCQLAARDGTPRTSSPMLPVPAYRSSQRLPSGSVGDPPKRACIIENTAALTCGQPPRANGVSSQARPQPAYAAQQACTTH